MAHYAQLKSQLKALKLSGLLETIELRIMEAQQNQLAFTEVLSMILNDEIETRQNRKLQRLITHARLDANKTLESFDFSFNPSINASLIRELATCNFIEKGENIFLLGQLERVKHILHRLSLTKPADSTYAWSSLTSMTSSALYIKLILATEQINL